MGFGGGPACMCVESGLNTPSLKDLSFLSQQESWHTFKRCFKKLAWEISVCLKWGFTYTGCFLAGTMVASIAGFVLPNFIMCDFVDIYDFSPFITSIEQLCPIFKWETENHDMGL